MADNARYDCGGGVAKGGHLVRARDSVRVRVGDMVRLLTMAILNTLATEIRRAQYRY